MNVDRRLSDGSRREEETVNKIKNILLEEKSKGKLIILSSHIKDDILLFFNDSQQ